MNKDISGVLKTERLMGDFSRFLNYGCPWFLDKVYIYQFKSTLVIRVFQYWVKLNSSVF